jgi:hypothetical protein
MKSVEDDLLSRIAHGQPIEQDEYDQLRQDLPPEELARALARRHACTNEPQALVEAARLFEHCGLLYDAVEVCSRAARLPELRQVLRRLLPRVQREYPETRLVGKLLEEAFIVIDLESGEIVRFPPLIPSISNISNELQYDHRYRT